MNIYVHPNENNNFRELILRLTPKKTEFALVKAAGPRKIKHQAYTPSEGFKEDISILIVPFLVQLVY